MLVWKWLARAPVLCDNQVDSKPEVFTNLRTVRPALKVKQGPAQCIGQNPHISSKQKCERIQHCLQRDKQKIHVSLCLSEPTAGLNDHV